MALILKRTLPLIALAFAIQAAVVANSDDRNNAKPPNGQEAAFQISEKEGKVFPSLADALAAADDDNVIIVSQDGPFPIANLEIKRRVTIKSSPGCRPVFVYTRPIDHLKLEVDYATHPKAATMFHVNANATIEGIHIQMDAPRLAKADWTIFSNNSSRLRLLNCILSTTSAIDFPAIRLAKDGVCFARNCTFSGFSPAIELNSVERTDVMLYSSLVLGRLVISTQGTVELNCFLVESSINAGGVFDLSGLKGAGNLVVENSIVKAKDLVTDLGRGERTFSGQANLYDVGTWVRKGSEDAKAIAELSEWKRHWDSSEKYSQVVYSIFSAQLNPAGPFRHTDSVDAWQPNPEEFDGCLARLADEPLGANLQSIGTGTPFEQFANSDDYQEWFKVQLPSDRPKITLADDDDEHSDESDAAKKRDPKATAVGKSIASTPRPTLLDPPDNFDYEPSKSYRMNVYIVTLRGRISTTGNAIGALFRFVDSAPSAKGTTAAKTVERIKSGTINGYLDAAGVFAILQQSRLSRNEASRWLKPSDDNIAALTDFRSETDRIIRKRQTYVMINDFAMQVVSQAIVVNELRRLTNADVKKKIYHSAIVGFLNLLPEEMEDAKVRSEKVGAYITTMAGTDPKIAVKVAERVYTAIDGRSRTRLKIDGFNEWWWQYSFRTLDVREAVTEEVFKEVDESEELKRYVLGRLSGTN